jgi:hypothetical protein
VDPGLRNDQLLMDSVQRKARLHAPYAECYRITDYC